MCGVLLIFISEKMQFYVLIFKCLNESIMCHLFSFVCICLLTLYCNYNLISYSSSTHLFMLSLHRFGAST
ncbi:hypothetical protein RIF29_27154 [Crotalaria pallida]|uniref:Uncharacterized protein n=1 Tax=Crotalaria pallida TaxID=3830 RepID=A0AAN9EQS1_CROPI